MAVEVAGRAGQAQRVLHVINGLGTGGAERSLAELLPRMRRSGLEPAIVCLTRRQEGLHDAIVATGIEVTVLRSTSFVGRLRELRDRIRSSKPDLVHTTIFEADVLGRCAASGMGIPVLTSLVNVSYDRIRLEDPRVRRHRLLAAQHLDGFTARHLTTHFHAITETVKEAAVRDLGIEPDDVTVVPRGRDPARLGEPDRRRRAAVRKRLGLAPGTPVLLNVARQEFQKGQRYLLEAVSLLRAAGHDIVTLVAGREGNATGELQELRKRLGLGASLRFLGHRTDVPDLLVAADLFVFPSLYEGLGGALIEAMALGLPIVASDLPAVREVVAAGGTAELVEPGRPDSLANAITGYLEDPSRAAEHAEAGRRRFLERFTLDRCGREMIDLFRRTAARTQAHPTSGEA